MKLCKDCKHFVPYEEELSLSKCGKPMDSKAIDLVSGMKEKREVEFCGDQRDADWMWAIIAPQGRCGKSGRWFEPKQAKS